MRFIHTSDWHLGKSLKGESLLDDQAHILDEIIRAVDDQDVYDRGVPPADAVSLFNETLIKLVERRVPILCVAGNHDSPQRLNFGAKLFERADFFIRSLVRADDPPIVLDDRFGQIYFSLIPYFDPSRVRAAFDVDDYISFDEAGHIFIGNALSKVPRGARSVAVAHAFITGGERSDSELQSVGGADNVSAVHFDACHYVALGHLHKHQPMGRAIRYSGSPLKYSFDEWQQRKGVLSVELDGEGRAAIEFLPLTPKHDLLVLEDTVDNILKSAPSTDYVAVRLTDKTAVLNARAKLETKFPNVLSIERIGLNWQASEEEMRRPAGRSMLEDFGDFYKHQTGETMSAEEEAAMKKFFEALDEEANL